MRPSTPPTDDPDFELATVDGAASMVPLRFARGEAAGPVTVGRRGAWRLDGNGLLGIHAVLLFDGADLYVKPSGPTALVAVDQAMARNGVWTNVPRGSSVSFGAVLTRYDGIVKRSSGSTRASAMMTAPLKALVVLTGFLVAAIFLALVVPRPSGIEEVKLTGAIAVTASARTDRAPTPARDAGPAAVADARPKSAPHSAVASKRAVDAMIGGRYAEAAELYRELSRSTNDPVYAVAERVARARATEPK